jgi:protoporphyrinogen oxidase
VDWITNSQGQKSITSIELIPTPASEVHDRDIEISGKILTDHQNTASNTPKTISAQQFVSSIPITELVQKLHPLPPEDIITAAKGLSYRDEVHVVIMVNKSHFTPDNWVYTQDQKLIFVRLMEMDSWTDGLSPAGTTSLVFEVACQEGDATWTMEDQKLVDMVADNYINEFHYFEKSDIIDSYVHRVPKEYPVYDIGYKEKITKIKNYLKEFSNLQCIGRNGTFKYNNSDHSIQMGLYAARNILGADYDLENVNTDRSYQEIKKEA